MTTTQRTPTDIVRALIDAIDNRDLATIDAVIADDLYFRFGSSEPTGTKAEFAATAQTFLASLAGIKHEVLAMWEVENGLVITTMDVHYERLDGRGLTLPCCNTFRVRDGFVHDYRIYMDVNPVFAP